uniref:Uncharacterized protein n=1 Tax=Erwinia amylovora ATCC BAA-2158 TaxID=889211 RepID=E5B1F1_ERWAM|nr:hypothetical protein predicted by Glimmer/Critica [Erwinia amylovora ATCC BAA-2158]
MATSAIHVLRPHRPQRWLSLSCGTLLPYWRLARSKEGGGLT